MSDDKNDAIPQPHKADKEAWETPRVIAAALKDTAADDAPTDDFSPS